MAFHGNHFRIESIDFRRCNENTYAAMGEFKNAIRKELYPEDQPISLSVYVGDWKNIPGKNVIHQWIVWENQKIVAMGGGYNDGETENAHMLWTEIEVRKECRRLGLGKKLLGLISHAAKNTKRRLLMGQTKEGIAVGKFFANHCGATPGIEEHVNQLLVQDAQPDLIKKWITSAPTDRFELDYWDGPYPEDKLEAICDLLFVMNTAPRGDLELNDSHKTPDDLRNFEKQLAATGEIRWTAYVTEKASKKLVGFTEMFWIPSREYIMWQGGTGVFPEFRGHGLGKWLKAAMIERILRERPMVLKLRTSNADSNEPMLAINHALGFKPYMASTAWQVATEVVLTKLNS